MEWWARLQAHPFMQAADGTQQPASPPLPAALDPARCCEAAPSAPGQGPEPAGTAVGLPGPGPRPWLPHPRHQPARGRAGVPHAPSASPDAIQACRECVRARPLCWSPPQLPAGPAAAAPPHLSQHVLSCCTRPRLIRHMASTCRATTAAVGLSVCVGSATLRPIGHGADRLPQHARCRRSASRILIVVINWTM